MKALTITLFAAAFLCAAQTPAPGAKTIHQRKERQQQRIAKGVESGQLTPGETAKLEKREAKLNQDIRADRAANGGKLTPKERRQVDRRQDRLSKDIYRQKHDGQARPN